MIADFIRNAPLPMAFFGIAVTLVVAIIWGIAHESRRRLNKRAGTSYSLVDWFEIGAYSLAARAWAFAHAVSSFRRRYAEVKREVQVEVDRLTSRPAEERA